MKKMKPEYFEMIVEEPVLQLKIANLVGDEPSNIAELAKDKDDILSIGRIPSVIVGHFNKSTPAKAHIKQSDLFQTVNCCIAGFRKSFVELHEKKI